MKCDPSQNVVQIILEHFTNLNDNLTLGQVMFKALVSIKLPELSSNEPV